jgi:hypothetical protein
MTQPPEVGSGLGAGTPVNVSVQAGHVVLAMTPEAARWYAERMRDELADLARHLIAAVARATREGS